MGADYYIYTEVRIDNEWHCINPIFDKSLIASSPYKDDIKLSFTYWNGSRSSFGSTANRLRNCGRYVDVSNLSPELQNILKEDDYCAPMIINYHAIKNDIPKSSSFQYHGYVHKDYVFRHETEGDDIYESFTYEEYNQFEDEKKKSYQYYEWDDECDWFAFYKEIIRLNDSLLYFWENGLPYYNDYEVRLVFLEWS